MQSSMYYHNLLAELAFRPPDLCLCVDSGHLTYLVTKVLMECLSHIKFTTLAIIATENHDPAHHTYYCKACDSIASIRPLGIEKKINF